MINNVHINCDRCIATMIMMIITIITPKGMDIMTLKDINMMTLMRILKTINKKLTTATFLNNASMRANPKI